MIFFSNQTEIIKSHICKGLSLAIMMFSAFGIGACTGGSTSSPADLESSMTSHDADADIKKITPENSEHGLIDFDQNLSKTFTTKGKATKIVETPSGEKEIYDPAKDETVIDAIRSLYQKGDTSFGDVARIVGFGGIANFGLTLEKQDNHTSTELEIETIKSARRVHYYDALRLGCKLVAEVPCQSHGSFYFKSQCPKHFYGAMELSVCEKENWHSDFTDIYGPIVSAPKGQSNLKGPDPMYHWTAYECVIDGLKNKIQGPLLIGNRSGYSLDETIRLLTNNTCLDWPEIVNSEK